MALLAEVQQFVGMTACDLVNPLDVRTMVSAAQRDLAAAAIRPIALRYTLSVSSTR